MGGNSEYKEYRVGSLMLEQLVIWRKTKVKHQLEANCKSPGVPLGRSRPSPLSWKAEKGLGLGSGINYKSSRASEEVDYQLQ